MNLPRIQSAIKDSRRLLVVTGLAGVMGLAALGGTTAGAVAGPADNSITAADTTEVAALSTTRDHAGDETTRNVRNASTHAGSVAALKAQEQASVAKAAQAKAAAKKAADKKAADKKAADKAAAEKRAGQVNTVLAQTVGLDKTQAENAKTIVQVAKDMGLNEKAQVIALSTAMQESNLYNLASGVIDESMNYPNQGVGWDHDSVGLFQQRPSSGWGSVKDLMNTKFQAKAFLSALKQVDGWNQMPVTIAAQTVQVSAFPDAYAKHQGSAEKIVEALNN